MRIGRALRAKLLTPQKRGLVLIFFLLIDPILRIWLNHAVELYKIESQSVMKKVTLANYKADPYYKGIVRAVGKILSEKRLVAPVEVFVRMKLLSKEDLEEWRFGRIPYLERVIRCNLSKASRILRVLRFHAHDLNLKPSHTAYVKWGKGRRSPLRFSKTGDANLEEAYTRHFGCARVDE